MRLFILLLFTCILSLSVVWGQDDYPDPDSLEARPRPEPPYVLTDSISPKGLFFHMHLGPSFPDLGPLNQELQRQLFQPLQRSAIALGLSGQRIVGPWAWGGEFISGTGQSRVNTQTTLLTFNHLKLTLGRELYRPSDAKRLALNLGLGGGLGTLKVQDLLQANPSRYFFGGPLADVNLHWTQYFYLQGSSINVASWGVSLGYQHTFDNAWILRGFDPERVGIPLAPRGVYLRLSLGMGNWRKVHRAMQQVQP